MSDKAALKALFPSIPSSPAQALLQDLSLDTWDRLRDSWRLGLKTGEETLTDNLLLGILRAGTPGLRVLKVDRAREARDGLDFELYVRRRIDRGFRRLAVQAKKLSEAGRYDQLRHRAHDGVRWQIDLLEDYCKRTGAEGAYCLYNSFNRAVDPNEWHCAIPPVREWLGISLASLSVAKALHCRGETKSFEMFHRNGEATPLRHLFCEPRTCGVALPVVRSGGTSEPLLPAFVTRDDGEAALELSTDLYPQELDVLPRFIVVLDEGQ